MKMETKLLITPREIKPTLGNFRVRGVFNPAGVRLENDKIMLFARVAETPKHGEKYFLAPRFSGTGSMKIIIEKIPRKMGEVGDECFRMKDDTARLPTISHFRKILLDKSGFIVERISQKPDFIGLKDDGDFGVEDPRITQLEGENRFAMTYVAVSMTSGISTSLAVSKDLNKWERKGIIFRQQNKDAVIFPEKINGYYVAMNRPEGTMIFDKPRIWLSYSKDLQFWGKDKPIMGPRKESWDGLRIGAGAVPLKTSEGWLAIYHGVHLENPGDDTSEKIYDMGAFLLDSKDPARVLARTPSKQPLVHPELEFEMTGFKNGVVFPTVAIPALGGKSLLVYSGAADSNIEVRKILLKDILNSLE